MKLKAKFGDVEIEVETDSPAVAATYYASWYGIVQKVIDEEAQMPKDPVATRETHH